MHYSFRTLDGYNKAFNLVISAREAGKSTAFWLDKAYKTFKKNGWPTLVFRRHVCGISEAYIKSLQYIINMFEDENLVLTYKKSDIKEGIVYIYIGEQVFLAIVGVSIDIERIKSIVLPNIGVMVYDEFICNPKFKEKYLENEVDKLLEIYNTFYRYRPYPEYVLKCYFLGNPYTMYNPYFEYFGVNTDNFKPGDIQVGSNWVVQNYQLSEELFQFILRTNPLYQRDDAYKDYALRGQNVNDANIQISKLKNGYYLYAAFSIHNDCVGIFRQLDITKEGYNFIAVHVNPDNLNRNIYCFDFSDLYNRNKLYSRSDVGKFETLKRAMRNNELAVEDIGIYYKLTEIYNVL